MTESVVLEEYGQMVAESNQRRQRHETELNNNIRGNYMDRLGVNTRARDRDEPGDFSKTNRMTLDTYDGGSNRNTTNLTYVRDHSSPKEIQRTELQMN